MNREQIHPEVRKAMDAVELPEVQEMMQRLGKHGLGIAVLHMHDDRGDFIPLPKEKVQLEDGLEISFKDADDPDLREAIPVAWRAVPESDPTVAYSCVWVCKTYAFCGHHNAHIKQGKQLQRLADAARQFTAGQLSAEEYQRVTHELIGNPA